MERTEKQPVLALQRRRNARSLYRSTVHASMVSSWSCRRQKTW